jgi:hypothetical protein
MQAIHLRDFGYNAQVLRRGRAIFVGVPDRQPCLEALGLRVEAYAEVFTAFSDMLDDSSGLTLFMLDCDSVGGIGAAQRLVVRLRGFLPQVAVVLLARTAPAGLQDLQDGPIVVNPMQGGMAIQSAVRHALRDRLICDPA